LLALLPTAPPRRCPTSGTKATSAKLPPVFRAIVATVVPESSKLDENGWVDLEALVAASLSDRPANLRLRLQLFLQLIQWLPLLNYRRPFSSLDPESRRRFLASLQNTKVDLIRVGFWGVRTLAFLGFYGRSEAREAIGYRPSPRGWEAVR
jgi:hypothetical protein